MVEVLTMDAEQRSRVEPALYGDEGCLNPGG